MVTNMADCQKSWHSLGMDLSSPLRSLAPTMDSAVLDVLAGSQAPMSIAHITRVAARGSRQGLTLALNRLVEQGLVTATPANRGSMYSLNREHVLAAAIGSAASARTVFIERFAQAVRRLEPEPLHVSFFGSFARREGDADSDIDVLFIVSSQAELDESWDSQVRELATQVFAWTGNQMHQITYNERELLHVLQSGEPIVESWRRESLAVLGVDFSSLVSSGRQTTP